MKKLLLAISIVSMMISCVQDPNKFVIAHRVDGNDTTTLRIIRVNKAFQIGDVVVPYSKDNKDTFRFKIVREYIRRN